MEQLTPPHEKKKKGAFRDFFEAFVIALLVALPIKYFIASPFIVVGSSMDNTFHGKDYLIINKIVYRYSDPMRGDVVVFWPPFSSEPSMMPIFGVNDNPPSEYFIKRVIGLPGETLIIKDNFVTIKNAKHPDGYTLNEPYVSSLRANDTEITLKDDEYFVMGDNRAVSSDSRVWGPIKKEEISGRADVRLFPFTRIGIMPGATKY